MREELAVRKIIRLKDYDYSGAGYYFITICTKDKRKIFGTIDVGAAICRPSIRLTDIGQVVDLSINNICEIYPYISVDKYVIMPNHVHMILCVGNLKDRRQIAAPTTVSTVIGNMKRYASMQCGVSVWQKSFYEHIIRNEEDYQRIWQYIDENIAKWTDDKYYISEDKRF